MKINLNSLIKRVLNISGNSELSAMIEYELSQPMFAHPGLSESYVKSFLGAGNVNEFYASDQDMIGTSVPVTIINGTTAIVDIRGAMLAKEIVAPCASSPTSYEAISFELSKLMDNTEVTDIVARFDTGGGVVSQCLDASDYIYSLRGQGKKLYAMVDDKAYSAGMGLATAFDEIWITRTGGVGSVGIVARFEDRSEQNKMKGISVEYLFAGDKKVFGNSDSPLSSAARKELLADIDVHYKMFTETVARNLGMSVADVVATQAGTYTGVEAIKIGFAHKLGTFNDLLNHIEGNDTMLTKEQIEEAKALKASIADNEAVLAAQKESLVALDNLDTESTDDDIEASSVDSEDAVVEDAEVDAEAEKLAAEQAAEQEAAELKAAEQAKADAEIQAAVLSREAGITAICKAAGKDDTIIASFIKSDMSLADIRQDLSALSSNDGNGDVNNVLSEVDKKAINQNGWDSAWGFKK